MPAPPADRTAVLFETTARQLQQSAAARSATEEALLAARDSLSRSRALRAEIARRLGERAKPAGAEPEAAMTEGP